MKSHLFLYLIISVVLGSCSGPSKPYLQKFAYDDVSKAVAVKVTGLSGSHVVGVICDAETMKMFMKHQEHFKFSVEPKSSFSITKGGFGTTGTGASRIENNHYLFTLSGNGDASLSIKIPKIFETEEFEFVVMRSPSQY